MKLATYTSESRESIGADEIPDPQHLQVTCRVNGIVKQTAGVSEARRCGGSGNREDRCAA